MKTFVSLLVLFVLTMPAMATDFRLAVTTSFNNSGLSDVLIPEIKKDTGISVRLLVVGTGQALRLGRSGDVDAILVHSREAEEQFIAQGYGTHRREIMYNDFVLIGPSMDWAKVQQATSVADALKNIAQTKSLFVSRGDESGTHRKEINLWSDAGMDVNKFEPSWYRSAGAGMGASLNTASGMNAYILSDRASWLKFSNKGDLILLYSGDPNLFNQYSYLPVSQDKHSHVKYELSIKLEAWLVSEKAQSLIANYRINGESLFAPNAH